MEIGIIGFGFVGKATSILKNETIRLKVYDKDPSLCSPTGTTIKDLLDCKVIFISVPTPMNRDGSCCLTIVEGVVEELQDLHYSGYCVIRSTLPVGTSDTLKCNFMPEFLTEKDYSNDFRTNPLWIFGEKEVDLEFRRLMQLLFSGAKAHGKIESDALHFMKNKEAEMVKLFRNCFLATKVSFCNEIHEFCEKKDIDYDAVRSIACSDSRITPSHSMVPGHDGKFGFGGTCFPKDTASLRYQMEMIGQTSYLVKAAVDRNSTVDRPEEDWKSNKGRAVNF
jgi:UDPglucose 6-dehydrogenase|tara:strand:- start:282 stop:1121 length:840 start_codon:yes stop_codon:yes gene_type:complete